MTEPTTEQPLQDPVLEERRIKALGESHIIVRRFSRKEAEDAWAVHSIELKSQRLRTVFADIFEDYPNWFPDDNPFTFFPPFKPLVHRWERFTRKCEAETNKVTKMEMHIFRREIEPLLSISMSALKEAKLTGVSDFKSLWLLFAPGDLMFSREHGNDCLFKLVAAELVQPEDDDYDCARENRDKPYWTLTLGQIDWDGSRTGFALASEKVLQFDQPRLLSRMGVYPFEFAPDQQKIQEGLLARGRMFESLRGFHVKTCVGRKLVMRREPGESHKKLVAEPINGRVIVDAHAFYKCQNIVPPQLLRKIVDLRSCEGKEPTQKNDSKKDERKEDIEALTDEERLTTAPLVKGFDLKAKEWCRLNVSEVRDLTWNDIPYQNLVLDDKDKVALTAFADHRAHKTGFDDFVEHKGEGIVILLCGPPGVGKTLTAEAIAERARVPLYILSAGELGSTPADFEKALKNALMCSQIWGAMLLLDEADVFLEARSSNSLERNELVAIFLRQLEYYQGLLFLTTNRISTIDPAFRSRIDLVIPYKDLDSSARKQVWRNFINRLPPAEVQLSDTDFDKLAETKINGRDIKNIIKTSLILAARDKPLRMDHIDVVLGLRNRVEEMEFGRVSDSGSGR
ncbi:P-loop containing nucleoside triphosphate hydrolase protein [Periconia macrospinosa]|uniref:P-loop containing nucleoside triphosphate hydrolase protein n=1 Tax=Periconia macrospinosa TaxID=97972 RepID=A0A2V1D6P8_9PLEO|nr:P-loop containing nucleoside triphosphate hydrolase protein [Periconia macrospinosa]